jgi:hypothetical protein
MPFDALVATKPTASDFVQRQLQKLWLRARPDRPPKTVLEKIGLIPVPAEVLKDHKDRVAEEFYRIYPEGRHRTDTRWFEYYQANTRLIQPAADTAPTIKDQDNQVLRAVARIGSMGIGSRHIPNRVYAIADAATRRAQKVGVATELVAGVFYIDPYLCLVYREDGEVKRACLAIWDNHTILRIATLT